jgi:hypothetical protein
VQLLQASISKTNNVIGGGDIGVQDASGEIQNWFSYASAGTTVLGANATVLQLYSSVQLSSATTYYVIGQATFGTSTMTACGSISARRRR